MKHVEIDPLYRTDGAQNRPSVQTNTGLFCIVALALVLVWLLALETVFWGFLLFPSINQTSSTHCRVEDLG